ncbi:MAG: hypothetical protein DDT32_01182 [Syntrophomonadaceae bacterium]|nr:hypothetical protein [Bacillota bacterium]
MNRLDVVRRNRQRDFGGVREGLVRIIGLRLFSALQRKVANRHGFGFVRFIEQQHETFLSERQDKHIRVCELLRFGQLVVADAIMENLLVFGDHAGGFSDIILDAADHFQRILEVEPALKRGEDPDGLSFPGLRLDVAVFGHDVELEPAFLLFGVPAVGLREEDETLADDVAASELALVERHVFIHGNLLTAVRRGVAGTSEENIVGDVLCGFPVTEMVAPGVEENRLAHVLNRLDHDCMNGGILRVTEGAPLIVVILENRFIGKIGVRGQFRPFPESVLAERTETESLRRIGTSRIDGSGPRFLFPVEKYIFGIRIIFEEKVSVIRLNRFVEIVRILPCNERRTELNPKFMGENFSVQ